MPYQRANSANSRSGTLKTIKTTRDRQLSQRLTISHRQNVLFKKCIHKHDKYSQRMSIFMWYKICIPVIELSVFLYTCISFKWLFFLKKVKSRFVIIAASDISASSLCTRHVTHSLGWISKWNFTMCLCCTTEMTCCLYWKRYL